MPSMVAVQNLSKVYDHSVLAVQNLSFEVSEGEIFGFLGPNGAGKSTTIGMLTTLLKPTSGTAQVAGYDIVEEASLVRQATGVVLQDNTADPQMTGYENLLFFADLQGVPRSVFQERAPELLALVELSDAAGRSVRGYSGGMKRRLELACGLVNEPKVLFLDEPTLGLDVQTRSAVWKYIRKLREERRLTVFLTTHYMEEADGLCDRIAIIDHGRMAALDSSENLKERLGGDLVELEVKSGTSDLTSSIRATPGVVTVVRQNSIYRITTRNGERSAVAILDGVRNAGGSVSRILVSKPSLADAYLEVTGRAFRDESSDSNLPQFLRRTFLEGQ